MKILKAHGEPGKHGGEFNHCDPDEVVGTHGFVCDSKCGCGCNRAFIGIHTHKATTLAIVAEVDEDEWDKLCDEVQANYAKAWGNDQHIGRRAALDFESLEGLLAPAPVGTIYEVRKGKKKLTLKGCGLAPELVT